MACNASVGRIIGAYNVRLLCKEVLNEAITLWSKDAVYKKPRPHED